MGEPIPVSTQDALNPRLKINEVFFSLQGESDRVGLPTVFIRLTGCPLRCQYCDTEYAFYEGEYRLVDELLAETAQYNTKHVCVSGGEPLAQRSCLMLLKRLCDQGYDVSLETSGAIDVSQVDPRVTKIMDLKTPDSAEQAKNRWENLAYIQPQDQIKFVICSESDYLWAKQLIENDQRLSGKQILMSPSKDQVSEKALADWIIRDQLPVRFQMQLHKILWGDQPGV